MPRRLPTRLLAPAHGIAVALTLYGLLTLIIRLVRHEPPALALFAASFIPVGAACAIWFTRRPADQLRWGHPFIFLVAVLAAARDILEISLDQRLDIRPLTLLTLGAAVVMLDRRWFAAILVLVATSWTTALLIVRGQAGAADLSMSLMSAMVVGLVMNLALTSLHRRREEAVARTQLVLDAIGAVGQGYLLTDGRNVLEVNDAYLELAKRTRAEAFAAKDVIDWTPEEDRPQLREQQRKRRAGEHVPETFDARLIRGDGTILDVEVSVKMLSTSPPLIFSIVRDISQRKESERRALAAQAAKDKVTAGLSHDLRSPLTAVIGFSKMLQQSWEQLEPAKRVFILEQVAENAHELEDMIDELLDFSRLEHGWSEIYPERITLRPWLEKWLTAKAPSLRNHQVAVAVPADAWVDADARALSRIIGNLVGNATKFAPQGSRITIGARGTASELELWVADEGMGISDDVLQRIFDPFTQGTHAASPSGIGMGLAVVKRYVDLHGGRVSVKSTAGSGATFTVTFPVLAAAAPARR